jgi:phosphomannomutase
MEQERESSIFRAYDIRGKYGKDITAGIMENVARAFAAFVENRKVVVGMDGRNSGPELRDAFVKGLVESGKGVTDVGLVALGVGMLHAYRNDCEYAFVTASHLPKEWNGVKFFHPNGAGFMQDENNRVRDIYFSRSFVRGKGNLERMDSGDVAGFYTDYMAKGVRARKPLRVVIDAGNGAASGVASGLFRKAGFSVQSVFDNVDGTFPNRLPDPMNDSLKELASRVRGHADLGIAFDGDGDRMAVLDEKGRKLSPEQVAYIILSELLKKEKGQVVANVECTRVIDMVAQGFGRKVIRIPVGHTYLTEAVQREKASFGVEVSGHYIVPSVVPFDDSLAVSLYFAAVLSGMGKPLSVIADSVPVLPFERVNFRCSDERKFRVVDSIRESLRKEYGKVNEMDGIRVDFPDGWALVRASNTGEEIRLSIEAKSRERLKEISREFSGMIKREIEKGA